MSFSERLEEIMKAKIAFDNSIEKATKSCLTCDQFDEENEICQLCNSRPPAKIIAFGCGQYSNLPF